MAWHSLWTAKYWALGNYDSQNVLDNATEVYNKMIASGWTHEASIGAIANLCYESSGINAGQWEGRNPQIYYGSDQGFGIAQWTPWTKVRDFVGGSTQAIMMDGNAQVEMLLSQGGQWNTHFVNANGYSSYYGITVPYFKTFAEYSQGSASVTDMTASYMVCWERPGKDNALETRKQYAKYFDEKLGGSITKKYVSILVEGNGTASAEPSNGESGTTVTLHQQAYGTDTFEKWEVISGDITITDNEFIIGDSNVTIRAVFSGETPQPTGSYKITIKIINRGVAYSVPSNYADFGDTVLLIADKISGGGRFLKWVSSDVTIDDVYNKSASFTMPSKDVTIYARFNTSMPVWMMLRPEWTMH